MLNTMYRLTLIACIVLGMFSCATTDEKTSSSTASEPEETVVQEVKKPVILFFGNSITAGYQLDIEEAFPALIQKRLDSLGYNYEVINAGLSGETTAAGVDRIDWVLRSVPDIFFLELGANDGLRGLPLSATKENLKKIMDKVRAANPEVRIMLAGMEVPPNLGPEYTEEFRTVFTSLAQSEEVALIPFLLDGVAGIPELNLEDGIHPTAFGHEIVAATVWRYLQPLLTKEEV